MMILMMKWSNMMNNTFGRHIVIVAAMACAVSCSKDIDGIEEDSRVEMEPFAIQAVSEDSTRAHISDSASGKATVVWDEGDAISFLSTTKGGNIRMEATDINGTTATFSNDIIVGTTTFAAVYPYTSSVSYKSGRIYGFSIPTVQNARPGSFDVNTMLSMATGEKALGVSHVDNLQFRNLCSVVAFTLPSNITFATEVTISTKHGEKLSGEVTMDYADFSISAPTSGTVVLHPASGTLESGKTFYAVIAPGTYADGLIFDIVTQEGNSYRRTTSKTLVALPGEIYTLGKLSLDIPEEAFSTSVSVSHDMSDGTLTGSTAVFSLISDIPNEFDGVIKSIVTSVTVAGNGRTYRTCTGSGKNVSMTMTGTPEYPYVPSGSRYIATIVYTVNNGTKDIEKTVVKEGNVAWSAPAGLSITATPTGYTSYSCYAGTDGQTASVSNANACDNATIYGVGATYVGGLSPAVKAQCDNEGLLSVSASLDGTEACGDIGGQAWGTHRIRATWNYDGILGSSEEKSVCVTGLPYNPGKKNVTSFKDDWSFSADKDVQYAWDDKFFKLRSGAKALFRGFSIPSNVKTSLYYKIKAYCSTSAVSIRTSFVAGTSAVIYEKFSKTTTWKEYIDTASITFTPSSNSMWCQGSGTSSSWATSQVQGFIFSVVYSN